MLPLIDHHHYRIEKIPDNDFVSKYERYLVDTLINSPILDSKRESSIAFELMHHHSTAQFARLLAKKRNLSLDVCTVGAALHDIYVIIKGGYTDHAHRGIPLAESILKDIGGFTYLEQRDILTIVREHSNKHIFTNNSYSEFGKDIDILDCFLYPGAFGYYLKHKPLSVFIHYIERAKHVWNELAIPIPDEYSVLENFDANWMKCQSRLLLSDMPTIKTLTYLIDYANEYNIVIPTMCLVLRNKGIDIYANERSWKDFSKALDTYFGTNELEGIAKMLFEKTKNITGIDNFVVENTSAILLWSALRSYEIIGNDDSLRLKELGIILK